MSDSKEYKEKKSRFSKILTIYGRNPVYEALLDDSITINKLHLATSNQKSKIIEDITTQAKAREIEIVYWDKLSLSRISKNAKQDQGVALDIFMKDFIAIEDILKNPTYSIIAIDSVTNPQNLGMIIRSACAGNIDALILPKKGAASISPLVIKASAGALFKMPIIYTDNLHDAIIKLKSNGAKIYSLSLSGKKNYKEVGKRSKHLFILGNESRGVSKEIESLCDEAIIIPMNRGVESLNVAVAASLLAFLD